MGKIPENTFLISILIVNMYLRKFSKSLNVNEIQIKIAMIYHLILVLMISETKVNTRKLELWVNTALWENSKEFLQNTKNRIIIGLSSLTFGYIPK